MRQGLILSLGLILCACAPDDGSEAVDAGSPEPVAKTVTTPAENKPVVPITEIEPAVQVIAQDVAYGSTPDHNLNGYLVLPADVTEPLPGVIMIHEWWGLNDNIRAMARRLAGEQYAVLAVDLYNGQTADTAAQAERLMSAVVSDRAATLDNLHQAYDFLDGSVLAPRIATLGFSLGGGWSLEAALEFGDSLDAAVMFYGQVIDDDERLPALKTPLLGIFAERDESVPVNDVQLFRRRLRDLDKSAEVLIIPGTDHAFLNPDVPAYQHDDAVEAWSTALEFLDSRLH